MKKTGVIFLNLGTPRSPEPEDVGNYLGEFLMDRHVIQIPWLFRLLLVRGIIVPFRKKKSSLNYKKVWTTEGSPLLVETEKAARALSKKLGDAYKVVVAMRYQEPSLQTAVEQLRDCEKIVFFPQYPQFADSTTVTSEEAFLKIFNQFSYKIVPPFYNHPEFIKAYHVFLQEQLKDLVVDHVLMSFHGLPESHITRHDSSQKHCLQSSNCCDNPSAEILQRCYRAQCFASARGIAKVLTQPYSVSFQSRLGRQKWIEPSTEETYSHLVQQGVKRLAVFCPGFPVDGLETLEEIAIAGRQQFLMAGGEEFHFLPCFNDHPAWIEACANIVSKS